MEHHFVVYFDEVTKTWHVDTETTDARFPGNVWNETINDWQDWNDNTSEALNNLIALLEIDSESDEPKKKTRDEMLAESEANYKCPECGTDCSAITCPEDEPIQTEAYQDIDPDSTYGSYPTSDEDWDIWRDDNLIEETDYLEEDK